MNKNKPVTRLKELRKERNLTLKELSVKVDISYSALSAYERGTRNPKYEQWKKLADYFGVSVGYLQGLTSENRTLKEFLNDSEYLEIQNKIENGLSVAQNDEDYFNTVKMYEQSENSPEIMFKISRLVDLYDNQDYALDDFSDLFVAHTGVTTIGWITELVALSDKENPNGQQVSKSDVLTILTIIQKEIIKRIYSNHAFFSSNDNDDK